jgi:sigma-E factor negative regulatory protein RseA
MDPHKKIREHISTLSDGELSDSDRELAFAALQSPDGQQAWNTYHRIGDALRARAGSELSDAFAETLVARLELEPVQLHKAGRAPSRPLYEQLLASLQRGTAPNMDQAANELLAVLQGLSSHTPDTEMVVLTVLARDTLAAAKGKGQLVGAQFGGAMKLCAIHWKRLYPPAGTGAPFQATVCAHRSRASELTNAQGTLWVEPDSGQIVDYEEEGVSYLAEPGSRKRIGDIYIWKDRFTPSTKAAKVAQAGAERIRISLLEFWLPAALACAGVIALVFGMRIALFSRRRHAAVSANAPAVVS